MEAKTWEDVIVMTSESSEEFKIVNKRIGEAGMSHSRAAKNDWSCYDKLCISAKQKAFEAGCDVVCNFKFVPVQHISKTGDIDGGHHYIKDTTEIQCLTSFMCTFDMGNIVRDK